MKGDWERVRKLKYQKKKKKKQSNPFTRFEGDNSEGIMSSSHEGVPDHGSALTAGLCVCPFVPRLFHHIHSTRMPSLRQRLAQQGTGGSVVEFSFTRREARVRFPPVRFSLIRIRKNVNDRKA